MCVSLQILADIRPKLLQLLPYRTRSVCDGYVSQVAMVAGELRTLVYKSVCPLLVKQSAVRVPLLPGRDISPHRAFPVQTLPLIADCGWDSRRLTEQHHEWVDVLVQNCADVWDHMERADQFAEAAALVREQVSRESAPTDEGAILTSHACFY